MLLGYDYYDPSDHTYCLISIPNKRNMVMIDPETNQKLPWYDGTGSTVTNRITRVNNGEIGASDYDPQEELRKVNEQFKEL